MFLTNAAIFLLGAFIVIGTVLSAVKTFVCTLTSWIASTDGRTPIEPMTRSLLSIPSMVWLFIMSACPLTETDDV